MILLDEIRKIFDAELNVPAAEFSETLKYGDLPEWDSASHMILVLALEDRFCVAFGPDEVPALTSVSAIEAELRKKGIE